MKKILIALMLVLLLVIPIVSADWDFNNIKEDLELGEDISEYGKIEIRDWYGLKSLATYELKENTEVCFNDNCRAEKEIRMYESGILIDEVRFEGDQPKWYGFYIKQGEELIPYNYKVMKAGTYTLILKGGVNPFDSTDWQIKVQGIWLTEWALWTSGLNVDLESYFGFNEVAGTNVPNSIDVTNNGTFFSGVCETDMEWVTGKIGNALSLKNNLTCGVNITAPLYPPGADPEISNVSTVDFTLSVWLKNASDWNGFPFGSYPYIDTGGNEGSGIELDSSSNILEPRISDVDDTFWIPSAPIGTRTDEQNNNGWLHYVFTFDSATNNKTMYINGIPDESNNTQVGNLMHKGLYLGMNEGLSSGWNGTMDELAVWSRVLNATEINESLYNQGLGSSPPTINTTLIFPLDGISTTNETVYFNCSAESTGNMITNISLYHNDSGTFALNQTYTGTEITKDSNTFTVTFLGYKEIEWNCLSCNNLSACEFGTNRTFILSPAVVLSSQHNDLTYETQRESFNITVEGTGETLGATLIYDGTEFTPTKTGNDSLANFSYTMDVPAETGNKSFYWNITSGSGQVNPVTYYQYINSTFFVLCNSTLNTTFLNISFRDEGDLSIVNATIPSSTFTYYLGSGETINKTYSLVNNTLNYEYRMCGFPNKTINTIPFVQYEGSGYPQRIWNPTVTGYNEGTTNQTLYLLSTADGLYVTLQTVNPSNQVIPGVDITVVRSISGTDVTVGTGVTGADGAVTFWLNPDYKHTFTFVAAGFTTLTTSFAPTQSSYTIILGGSSAARVNDYTRGITILTLPSKSIQLINGTSYNFNYTLNSSYWVVSEFGFSLTANGTTLGSISASANGGIVDLDQNTGNYSRITMNYYWVINDSYQNRTTYWNVFSSSNTEWSIKTFFDDFNAYLAIGIFGLDDFGRYLIIFLILFFSVGIVSFRYGLTSPIAVSSIIFAIIFFFDVVVDLIPQVGGAIPNFPTFISALILVTMIFREATR